MVVYLSPIQCKNLLVCKKKFANRVEEKKTAAAVQFNSIKTSNAIWCWNPDFLDGYKFYAFHNEGLDGSQSKMNVYTWVVRVNFSY